MQKWTLIAPLLLMSAPYAVLGQDNFPPLASNQLEIPAVSPEQDHIASMMEDNFNFETEHRKLVNELALEELRSKLSKLKNEPLQGDVPDSSTRAPQHFAEGPKVLLISDIAGVSRVAIAVGKQVKMVRLNEVFQANGKAYRLQGGAQRGAMSIKEVTP